MSVITRLDLTASGDTGLECFTTLDANDLALNTLADTKAATDHTHGAGGEVLSIVANEAALVAGTTDGEQAICSVTGNVYMWEAGTEKWQPREGNQYATSGLPTTTYNILTGTRVYDTTVARMKYWNGTAFIVDDCELRRSFAL